MNYDLLKRFFSYKNNLVLFTFFNTAIKTLCVRAIIKFFVYEFFIKLEAVAIDNFVCYNHFISICNKIISAFSTNSFKFTIVQLVYAPSVNNNVFINIFHNRVFNCKIAVRKTCIIKFSMILWFLF